MAEYNHRQILQEGAKPWNEWRASNPGVIPDLRYLDLSLGQKQFGPINGGPIDLRAALLFKADFRNATLIEADLRDAELIEAEFGGARLDSADLRGAKLVDSSLIGANLAQAKLDGADLTGADLTSARNLSQYQVNTALGDVTTQLPFDLVMPKSWIVQQSCNAPPGDLPNQDDAVRPLDLYEILGAKKTDSNETIHAVYRVRAKSLHPDLNPGSLGAEDAFRRLTYAYAILRDPARRKRYDAGEIGPDGEETESYRYAVWRAANMRRYRTYVAVSLVVAVISCGVILSQLTLDGGKSDYEPVQNTVSARPQPNAVGEAAQSTARSKIQSRMAEGSDDSAPVKAEDQGYEKTQGADPEEIDPAENTFALKTEETGDAAADDPPVEPGDAVREASLTLPETAISAQIAEKEMPTPAILLPQPPSNALGPRLDKSLEPMPLVRLQTTPKFTILGPNAQAKTTASAPFVGCRTVNTRLNASFDWVAKFRINYRNCNPANLAPAAINAVKKQASKGPTISQSRLQTDVQPRPMLSPDTSPQKKPGISSDVLSGGF